MMMVLEIEIDDDCVVMRAMLPTHVSTKWAYVLIGTTSIFFAMFLAVALAEIIIKLCGAGQAVRQMRGSSVLQCFSFIFVGMVIIMFIISLLAYLYSVVLSLYLAYTVPGDSAVMLGSGASLLALFTDVASLYKPEYEKPICM